MAGARITGSSLGLFGIWSLNRPSQTQSKQINYGLAGIFARPIFNGVGASMMFGFAIVNLRH